jgi:hypothetical protein
MERGRDLFTVINKVIKSSIKYEKNIWMIKKKQKKKNKEGKNEINSR